MQLVRLRKSKGKISCFPIMSHISASCFKQIAQQVSFKIALTIIEFILDLLNDLVDWKKAIKN